MPACWPGRPVFSPEPEFPRPPLGGHRRARLSAGSPSLATLSTPPLDHVGPNRAIHSSALSFVGVLCIRSILSVFPSDLPGVNPATLNEMILYYRLMTKWSGLGDSTELSRVGLSQLVSEHPYAPE
jgi:hypothetical protein